MTVNWISWTFEKLEPEWNAASAIYRFGSNKINERNCCFQSNCSAKLDNSRLLLAINQRIKSWKEKSWQQTVHLTTRNQSCFVCSRVSTSRTKLLQTNSSESTHPPVLSVTQWEHHNTSVPQLFALLLAASQPPSNVVWALSIHMMSAAAWLTTSPLQTQGSCISSSGLALLFLSGLPLINK